MPTLGNRRDARAVIQFASFRTGPKTFMQNTKAASLWRQTKDTEEVQFVSHLLTLVGPRFSGWRKLHVYELSAVNTNPRPLTQPVQLLFVGCIRNLPTASSALVYKPFCMETFLRHYSQKTNAKLTEPLDIKPEPVVNFQAMFCFSFTNNYQACLQLLASNLGINKTCFFKTTTLFWGN